MKSLYSSVKDGSSGVELVVEVEKEVIKQLFSRLFNRSRERVRFWLVPPDRQSKHKERELGMAAESRSDCSATNIKENKI